MQYSMRRLKPEDRAGMAEWMKEEEITQYFNEVFSNYTEEMIDTFIRCSFDDANQHHAIVNQWDEYMGTVSLKKIDLRNKHAEYAIVMRKSALHTGAARAGTMELMYYGFHVLGLEKIYLNVLKINQRAIRFYERIGFTREGIFRRHCFKNGEWVDLEWYSMLKEEFMGSTNAAESRREDKEDEKKGSFG